MNSLQYISTQVDSLIGNTNEKGITSTKINTIDEIEENDEKQESAELQASPKQQQPSDELQDPQKQTPEQQQQQQQEPQKENAFIYLLLYIPRAIARMLAAIAVWIPFINTYFISPTTSQSSLQQSEREDPSRSLQSPYSKAVRLPSTGKILFPPRPLLRSPKNAKAQKTLVLDLDETLIHSLSRSSKFSQGQMVEIKLDNSQLATLYFVNKRPYCDEFLKAVSQWYKLVVFTASVQQYADPMIDWLEKDRKYFSARYYRQHCIMTPTGYVKDLSTVEQDPSKVVIIDNSPVSYMRHEQNAIAIEGWISDPSDHSLLNLLPFLNALRYSSDVRSIISLKVGENAFDTTTTTIANYAANNATTTSSTPSTNIVGTNKTEVDN